MVEIANRNDVPARAWIAQTGGTDQGSPVQFPDKPFTRVVLPQEVGVAVTVEVAGRFDVPIEPGVA